MATRTEDENFTFKIDKLKGSDNYAFWHGAVRLSFDRLTQSF